jgi:alcohol dehydrogenase
MKGTGVDVQGGHAEYMIMNSDATYLIPDEVSYEQAAPIFCAGYTVYGGLGHLAVQYAKAAGFETIAVSHSPDKDRMIRGLGADEIVRDGKSLAAAGGADVILSTSNSTKSMVDTIQGLRPDGRLVAMGADAEPLRFLCWTSYGSAFGSLAVSKTARNISTKPLISWRKEKLKR